MLKCCIVLIGALIPQVALAQRATTVRPPIIDMHMHIYEVTLGTDGKPLPIPCAPVPCKDRGPTAAATTDDVLRLTLQQMDRFNIVKGFLSSDNLAKLPKWTSAARGRFIPSPFIWEPRRFSIEELRAEYKAGRLAAMGEIATQYFSFAPTDPALEPYFALAEELDLPTHIHTAGFGAPLPGFRVANGNPVLLEPVLQRHPKLRLFVENAGYPFLGEMVAMMYQYPQLRADLSTITWIIPREAFHDYLRGLIRAGVGDRLMFGSDQMQWPETIGIGIEAINSATFLTEAQRRDIFYNNAARFLRITAPGR